jgi:imidazolonepropionase-like amidohydrolase
VNTLKLKSATLARFAATIISILVACGVAAENVLIQNADIETMTQRGRLTNTDLWIVDGKIKLIGKALSAPGATVIDGQGKRVTPGVFNAFTQLGIVEISAIEETRDSSADNEQFTASLNVIDAFNPYSTSIPQNRIHGVTQALVAPEAKTSLFAGKVSIVNLSGSVTDSIEKSAVGVLVNYNEFGQQQSGGSRAAALATIRNALLDAKDFSEKRDQYFNGDGRDLSLSFDDLDALRPVLERDQYLLVNVDRSSDILKVLDLGKKFNLRLILVGVQEGWMVATEIASAKAAVIMDPTNNLPTRFETLGSRLDNAAILHKAGVTLMFTGMSGQNTHNGFLVTQSAGNAVANGLPYQAALKAIFTNPAKVFGLSKPGQLAAGVVADLVLWNNDPLEVLREAELVMVNGKQIPMVSRATRLRDRYFDRLRADMALPSHSQ